jgi:hypothetical protein
MANARPGRCWYCGKQRLREDDPPEHVILAAFGGKLTTDRICRDCNERAGREIDWPFQNDWLLAQLKLAHGVQSARSGASGRGRTGSMRAHIAEEPEAVVDIGRDFRPSLRSRITPGENEGEFTVSAGSEQEARRVAQKQIKRLEAEGHQVGERSVHRESFDQVAVQISFDGVLWLRSLSKMVLATLSLCLPDEWLDGADAKRLQRWLWDAVPVHDDGSAAFTFPGDPHNAERYVAPAPTHVVTVVPLTPRRVMVSVGLFGGLYVRAGVNVDPPAPDACWIVAPGVQPRSLRWAELLNEATRIIVEQHKAYDMPDGDDPDAELSS